MNSHNRSSKLCLISMFIFNFSQKVTLSTIPNNTSHLKNPKELILTTSKPYILHLLQ